MISIEVRAAVPYAEIAAQATAALRRRPVAIDEGLVRGTLHVDDVRIQPSGARLAVAVAFVASLAWPMPRVRGVVHLSATPAFDADAQSLRLREVAFEADVGHVLVRAALALKHRAIVKALADLSFDLGPILGQLRDRMNLGLADHRLAPGVAVQGRVDVVRVHDVLLEEELVVVASATGQLRWVIDTQDVEPTPAS